MKRLLSFSLLLLMVLSLIPAEGFAVEEKIVVTFEDGSYITECIECMQSRAAGSKTGTKSYKYYNEDDVICWKFAVNGTFTYTGSTSQCTASSCDVTVYTSEWYTVSKSSGKSGNTASASVTMGRKLLGVTVATIPVSLTLTCDNNGNLS